MCHTAKVVESPENQISQGKSLGLCLLAHYCLSFPPLHCVLVSLSESLTCPDATRNLCGAKSELLELLVSDCLIDTLGAKTTCCRVSLSMTRGKKD